VDFAASGLVLEGASVEASLEADYWKEVGLSGGDFGLTGAEFGGAGLDVGAIGEGEVDEFVDLGEEGGCGLGEVGFAEEERGIWGEARGDGEVAEGGLDESVSGGEFEVGLELIFFGAQTFGGGGEAGLDFVLNGFGDRAGGIGDASGGLLLVESGFVGEVVALDIENDALALSFVEEACGVKKGEGAIDFCGTAAEVEEEEFEGEKSADLFALVVIWGTDGWGVPLVGGEFDGAGNFGIIRGTGAGNGSGSGFGLEPGGAGGGIGG
jgi:hypothetical protein